MSPRGNPSQAERVLQYTKEHGNEDPPLTLDDACRYLSWGKNSGRGRLRAAIERGTLKYVNSKRFPIILTSELERFAQTDERWVQENQNLMGNPAWWLAVLDPPLFSLMRSIASRARELQRSGTRGAKKPWPEDPTFPYKQALGEIWTEGQEHGVRLARALDKIDDEANPAWLRKVVREWQERHAVLEG